jgi:hypothetical protein
VISVALGAAAFTVRRAACTIDRTPGESFLSCSESVISEAAMRWNLLPAEARGQVRLLDG